MIDLRERLRSFTSARLESLLRRPRLWGSNESIELQTLAVLEILALVENPNVDDRTLHRELIRAHDRFASREVPERSPLGLAHDLAGGEGEFTTVLSKFVDEWKQTHPPVNPFEQHPLVLRMALRAGVEMPRASTVATGFETFRKVLRAVAREAPRGRSGATIEQVTDFVMSPIDVVNESGTRSVLVPLRPPPVDQINIPGTDEATEILHKVLAQLVSVADWAQGDAALEKLAREIPAEEARKRVVYHALRLVPRASSECQSFEIGGSLISRLQPVILRPSVVSRLFDVLKEAVVPQPFTRRGQVRMQDLDFGTIALRPENSRQRIEISLSDELLAMKREEWLDATIEVTGESYREHTGRIFYFATAVTVVKPAEVEG